MTVLVAQENELHTRALGRRGCDVTDRGPRTAGAFIGMVPPRGCGPCEPGLGGGRTRGSDAVETRDDAVGVNAPAVAGVPAQPARLGRTRCAHWPGPLTASACVDSRNRRCRRSSVLLLPPPSAREAPWLEDRQGRRDKEDCQSRGGVQHRRAAGEEHGVVSERWARCRVCQQPQRRDVQQQDHGGGHADAQLGDHPVVPQQPAIGACAVSSSGRLW